MTLSGGNFSAYSPCPPLFKGWVASAASRKGLAGGGILKFIAKRAIHHPLNLLNPLNHLNLLNLSLIYLNIHLGSLNHGI